MGPSASLEAAIAISGDGNTLVVGGMSDNIQGIYATGATWVFTRSGGVWAQQGSKLVGTGATAPGPRGGGQGASVGLSNDGLTAVVGSTDDNMSTSAAWVFVGPAPLPAPGPVISGIESAASYLPGVVSNSWVTILGTNLAPRTDNWSNSIVNGNLPFALDGVSVSDGRQTPPVSPTTSLRAS